MKQKLTPANRKTSDVSNTKSTWRKAFQPSKWEDKDEFLDVIYWGRQVLSVVIGAIWGILGLTGFFGIVSYLALTTLVVYIYSVNFNLDNDDVSEDVKEGFMTSFAAFLVTWTSFYSYVFFS